MRSPRRLNAATRTLRATLIIGSAGLPLPSASGGALQLVDDAGVVHLTNAPADPRYRGVRGHPGTDSGRLRLPVRPRREHSAAIRATSHPYAVISGLANG